MQLNRPEAYETTTELELMERGGMAPAEVLRATTSVAARLMGVDRARGTVQPGKDADLVVLAVGMVPNAADGESIRALIDARDREGIEHAFASPAAGSPPATSPIA